MRRLWLLVVLGAAPAAAQVDVTTHRYDNFRSGANLKETTLTTANVNKQTFGKRVFRLVEGNPYAQPLIVSRAKVAGRTGPTSVALVATEANFVYAFDADDVNQAANAQLWRAGPLRPPLGAADLAQIVGPGCNDLTTQVGITSTPAVMLTRTSAPKEGVVFVVAKSRTAYTLFALRLSSGQELAATEIAGEVDGKPAGAGKIRFDPAIHLNRPALLLAGKVLYVAFGGHCDRKGYHGWVFAYDVSGPAPKLLDLFCTTPAEPSGRAGIWMSGQGPAADEKGNVYLATGDGAYDGESFFGDSVLKMKLDGSKKLRVQGWFSPENREELEKLDGDLGAGGAILVPGSRALLAGGKEGRLYLIDRERMGTLPLDALRDSFQVTNAPFDRERNPAIPGKRIYWNLHGSPVFWPRPGRTWVYVAGEEDHLRQYELVPDKPGGLRFAGAGTKKVSKESAPLPNPPQGLPGDRNEDVWMPGGFLTLSANGAKEGTGILWATMPLAKNANHTVVDGVLRAFDAADISKGQLWSSADEGVPADSLGLFAKFSPPTVANGKVYVTAFDEETVDAQDVHHKLAGGRQAALVIYGLK